MGVETWMPEELNKPYAAALEEASVAEILAAFQFNMDPMPAVQSKAAPEPFEPFGNGQRDGRAEVRYAAWEPVELFWQPPARAQAGEDLWPQTETFNSDANLIHEGELQTAPKTEQEKAEQEAAQILSQARQQAEELLVQAQLTADETLREAQEEAQQTLQAAMGEGYRQGWAKAEEEAASALRAAAEVVRQFNQWREGMFAQSETILLEMVRQTARTMFGDGVHLEPQALEANLNRVLENAKSLGDLKVYLHPGDAEKLDPAWREYQQLITGNRVQVIPSDGIKPGGCFVQGQMGTVDARVETQLRAVMEVFVDAEGGEGSA